MTLRTDLMQFSEEEITKCFGSDKAKAMALALKGGETLAAIGRKHGNVPQVVRRHIKKVISQCGKPFPSLSVRANAAALMLGATSLAELKDGVERSNFNNIGQKTIDEIRSAFREGR